MVREMMATFDWGIIIPFALFVGLVVATIHATNVDWKKQEEVINRLD